MKENYNNKERQRKKVTEKDCLVALDTLNLYFEQLRSSRENEKNRSNRNNNSKYPPKPHVTSGSSKELILNVSIYDSGLSKKAINNLKSINCSGCMGDLLKIGRSNLFRVKRLKEYRDEIDNWFNINEISKWFES